MTDTQKEAILAYLKKNLSPGRLKHSLAVGDLASKLARKNGWSPDEALWAGRLHDCAKEWSPSRLKSYVDRMKIAVPAKKFIFETHPSLLHAYAGAHFARSQSWGVTAKMARAIRSHTLGRANMSLEEKVLFTADFASTDRSFPSAKKVRNLALKNLKEGFRLAAARKISFQLKLNKPLHPDVYLLWNKSALSKSK